MTLENYQPLAERTMTWLDKVYSTKGSYIPEHALDLVHMRLGLGSELGELYMALLHSDKINIKEELGDLMWYVANDLGICKNFRAFFVESVVSKEAVIELLNFRFTKEFLMFKNNPVTNMVKEGGMEPIAYYHVIVYNVGELIDHSKKYLAYQKPCILEDYGIHITNLMICINNLAYILDINMEEAMERNIAKLKARYGDKFSSEKAINRNTNEERKILES